jgi:hypothetical protein
MTCSLCFLTLGSKRQAVNLPEVTLARQALYISTSCIFFQEATIQKKECEYLWFDFTTRNLKSAAAV